MTDDIKTELQFVGKYWRLSGRPTVCLLIKEEHMRDPQFKEMLDLLAQLKKGNCDGMKGQVRAFYILNVNFIFLSIQYALGACKT